MADHKALTTFINQTWDKSIIPALSEYIRIPNKSPLFDKNWQKNGYMHKAVELLVDWVKQQNVHGLTLDIINLEQRTPLIFIEIAGQSDNTVLLYGHLDKQPEMEGWDSDKNPWQPLLQDDKLYGRGGADDGYSTFAAVTAIKALQQQGIKHPRCVIVIEGCEESGSYDLPYYIEHLRDRIGIPKLVVCLDSGCMNYEQLWCTTSLRGVVSGTLTVNVLTEGIHSGAGTGVVSSSFRILRQLLSRIEDEKTGEILLADLHVDIPKNRIDEAKHTASELSSEFYAEFPLINGMQPVTKDVTELILNRTWRPTLAVTGIGGVPAIENAGNVLRPKTSAKLSFRLPPTCNPQKATAAIKSMLEKDPPYSATVTFNADEPGTGWNAPVVADWLLQAADEASRLFYDNKPVQFFGEGGTIPFMGLLGDLFPKAQFLIVGVLGPKSNAHGPNEFLHIPMAKNLTACVSYVLNKACDI